MPTEKDINARAQQIVNNNSNIPWNEAQKMAKSELESKAQKAAEADDGGSKGNDKKQNKRNPTGLTMSKPGARGEDYRELRNQRDPRKQTIILGQDDEETAKIEQEHKDQTDRIVNTAKENLKDVPGALTGEKDKEQTDENGEAEEGLNTYNSTTTSTTEEKDDTPYKPKRAYSIWDAYKKGMIDKGGATYYTIDSIANFLKNTGRGIGNVGAQFTGGTIDNNVDQSEWNKAMNVMNEEQRELWGEQMGGRRSRKAVSEDLANKITELNKAKLGNAVEIQAYCMRKAKAATNKYDRMLWMALAQNGLSDPGSAMGAQAISDAANWLGNKTGWFN